MGKMITTQCEQPGETGGKPVTFMPIEVNLLKNQPPMFKECPLCEAEPFEPFLRGTIQRGKRTLFGLGKPRAYCAVICSECKEIVGYESP